MATKSVRKRNPVRDVLTRDSQVAKAMRECNIKSAKTDLEILEALSLTINHFLIEMYKQENLDISDFRTLKQWRDDGFQVSKGSKASYVWGTPRNTSTKKAMEMTNVKTGETETKEMEDKYEYWPMCALFNNTQVEVESLEKEAL